MYFNDNYCMFKNDLKRNIALQLASAFYTNKKHLEDINPSHVLCYNAVFFSKLNKIALLAYMSDKGTFKKNVLDFFFVNKIFFIFFFFKCILDAILTYLFVRNIKIHVCSSTSCVVLGYCLICK